MRPPAGTEGYSLQRRLLTRLFGVLAVLGLGLFLAVAGYAQRAADRAYDRLLLASALAVADAVLVEDGGITVDLPYAALAILAMARRDRVFYRVTAPDGALITGYEGLGAAIAPARSGEPRFGDALHRGVPVRAAALGRFVAGGSEPAGGGWVTIVVAQTREERDAFAREILANAFAPIALTLVVGAALIWFGVRRALAPLDLLERIIRARRPTDLSPIDAPAPAEVGQLVAALNRLMERLHASLVAMQTFLADAAHQVRTPLAGLRAQATLAAEEEDPATLREQVVRIERNAAIASQLTNQLLNHAMVTYRNESAPRREAVDLGALVRQVVRHAEGAADGVPIEVDLDGVEDGRALVEGDAVTLREALGNLVDNAVKYAGAHGPVRVRLERPDGGATLRLEVADRGPGVPDGEKERVLERFGRGSSAGAVIGSGLGLAIVRAVADAHGASLALLDRPGGGLVVRLDFPAAPGGTATAGGGRAPLAGSRPWLALALLSLLAALPPARAAADTTLYPARGPERERLRIHSATDRSAIEPLLADFQAQRPGVAIEYADLDTNALYASVVAAADGAAPDLVISSAMDLQAKLVNDGYTQPHRSHATSGLPDWANWRDEAFGFTYEPVVIAYHRGLVAEAEVPRSRPALIRLLQDQTERYRRRVASYDVGESGVGYLFAAHDSVLSSQFWRLVAALGNAQVRLFGSSAAILDAIERGEVLIGYNVLGSYARARRDAGAPIGIVLPEDYTLVMSRVAVIPKRAGNPMLARLFVDYVLSDLGQAVVAGSAGLYAIAPRVEGAATAARLTAEAPGRLHPITLGPALLVFADRLKKARFLANWRLATQPP